MPENTLLKKLGDCKTNDEITDAVFSVFPELPDDCPAAYKAGKWFFYGLPFYVDKNVLIPRFDTQILADTVIKKAGLKVLNVLDLCTGSGCVAVAVAKYAKGAKVYASDISGKALKIAKKNAELNNVDVKFIKSDLFEHVFEQFDIIVCNPPYIKTNEIGRYDRSILNEPHIALDGGEDGLEFYRKITETAGDYLCNGEDSLGMLALEIGHDQAEAVKSVLQSGGFCDTKVIKDKQGLDRVITCRKIVR